LEEQSETKGISTTFSKSKLKRIGLFQKFGKTKQSEVNLLKILQDRSKTNVFVPNCVKEEKRENEASFFFEEKMKKNEYNRSYRRFVIASHIFATKRPTDKIKYSLETPFLSSFFNFLLFEFKLRFQAKNAM
jgi:hypothetical protein